MGSLVDDGLLDTGDTVEDDGARATADVVDGGVEGHDPDGGGDGQTVDVVEGVSHGWLADTEE